jgi:hypothetical protein
MCLYRVILHWYRENKKGPIFKDHCLAWTNLMSLSLGEATAMHQWRLRMLIGKKMWSCHTVSCGFRVQDSGFRIRGTGFRVQGSWFRVRGSGFGVQVSGFRFQVSGFKVQGSEFRIQISGFKVQGAGSRVQGPGFRVQGSDLRVQGAGFGVRGSGFRVQGAGPVRRLLRSRGEIQGSGKAHEQRSALRRGRQPKGEPFLSKTGLAINESSCTFVLDFLR